MVMAIWGTIDHTFKYAQFMLAGGTGVIAVYSFVNLIAFGDFFSLNTVCSLFSRNQ